MTMGNRDNAKLEAEKLLGKLRPAGTYGVNLTEVTEGKMGYFSITINRSLRKEDLLNIAATKVPSRALSVTIDTFEKSPIKVLLFFDVV